MSKLFLRDGRGARPAMFIAVCLALVGRAHAEGDIAHGEKLFEECAACHSTVRGENKVGPSLSGLFERKAAELEDFRYSPALKRSGIAWTAETVDTFIADPQKAVPANRMPYAGMPDAANRTDLIAYLRKVAK